MTFLCNNIKKLNKFMGLDKTKSYTLKQILNLNYFLNNDFEFVCAVIGLL